MDVQVMKWHFDRLGQKEEQKDEEEKVESAWNAVSKKKERKDKMAKLEIRKCGIPWKMWVYKNV